MYPSKYINQGYDCLILSINSFVMIDYCTHFMNPTYNIKSLNCSKEKIKKFDNTWDIICRLNLFSFAAFHVASILLQRLLNVYGHSNCIPLLFGAQIRRYFSPPWNSKLLPPQTAYMLKGHVLPILTSCFGRVDWAEVLVTRLSIRLIPILIFKYKY